jgi:tetratricopeptide (TPR) repeat protein
VKKQQPRTALLTELYRQFLSGQPTAEFVQQINQRYSVATLERLAVSGHRETRRAAILSLGLVGDYQSNAVVGRALVDVDRGVRNIAENSITTLWRRAGNEVQRQRLGLLVRLNSAQQFHDCIRRASELIADAPHIAEAWNQRAIAHYSLGQYRDSIRDCHQTLEINPYHYGAASGMGQCYLQLGNNEAALESFRRALKLNPNLEGVRASVTYLERAQKKGRK